MGVGTPPLSPNIVNVANDGCDACVKLSSDDSFTTTVVDEFFQRIVIVGISVSIIAADAENDEGVNDGTKEPGEGAGDNKLGVVASPVVDVDDDDVAMN